VLGLPLFVLPRRYSMAALKLWARSSLWLLKIICGTDYEVRGLQHIPEGAVLIAGKHQSFWETFAVLPLLADPCMVLKRELTLIPLFGWFALKFRMIAVARSAGPSAMRDMVKRAKAEVALGRQIVIMPEGTRRGPDDPPDYKPGAAALYALLKIPCVPFGLNAGLFWPRRQFLRRPGTIVIEFLPVLPPGLSRDAFQRQLEEAIETTTARLVAEGRAKQN
jgi:1-acyl-sn-glycerol-3-phosphate acyltransferase